MNKKTTPTRLDMANEVTKLGNAIDGFLERFRSISRPVVTVDSRLEYEVDMFLLYMERLRITLCDLTRACIQSQEADSLRCQFMGFSHRNFVPTGFREEGRPFIGENEKMADKTPVEVSSRELLAEFDRAINKWKGNDA